MLNELRWQTCQLRHKQFTSYFQHKEGTEYLCYKCGYSHSTSKPFQISSKQLLLFLLVGVVLTVSLKKR